MSPLLRLLAALVLAAIIAFPASAQDDRDLPDDDGESAVTFERDGDVYHFRITPPNADQLRGWLDKEQGYAFRDTVIDGRHVIRFRTPFREELDFEHFDREGFHQRVMPELERFRVEPPDLFFKHDFFERDGEPFGLRMREMLEGPHGLNGLSEETRREMLELERRAHELAAEARRAEGRDRDEIERDLDDALGQLFDARGRMREAQADSFEAEAERLREEAQELRQSLREREQERRALIEERKRELLGEPGADW